MKVYLSALFVFVCSLCISPLYAQQSSSLSANDLLFGSEEPLKVELVCNFKALLKDRDEEREYHPATLTYTDEHGQKVVMEYLKLRTRGNFRRKRATCAFPPIRLNFVKDQTEGTLFEGQDKLKLVTHCQNKSSAYQQYVLQEYLIYKMYNLLTPYSFRVRLLDITYVDSAGKYEPMNKHAFIIEDEDLMAERLGGKMVEIPGISPLSLDQEISSRLAIFQFMVGNTDFSLPYMHNVKLLQIPGQQAIIPIPYDFDWSGLISAPYAVPNETLGIKSVRERVFRGFCRPKEEFKADIQLFIDKNPQLLAVVSEFPLLNEKTKKRTLKYLQSFFNIIESPSACQREIFQACREI